MEWLCLWLEIVMTVHSRLFASAYVHSLPNTELFRGMLLRRLLWALALIFVCAGVAHARDRDAQLAVMSIDLMPVMLRSIQASESFPASMNKYAPLRIRLVYSKRKSLAQSLEQRLLKEIKPQWPNVDISLSRARDILSLPKDELANIDLVFLVDPLKQDLPPLLERLNALAILSYSPRLSDLKRGVALGISVTERVLPAVNLQSLNDLGLEFSTLFMRIAVEVE